MDVQQASMVQVMVIHEPDLTGLEGCRARLADTPHCADSVGEVGGDWLGSVLGNDIVEAIRAFPASPYKALLLRGIALSTEVATPCNGFLPNAQCVLDFDLLQFGMLRLLGVKPHAVEYENHGKLVRNVVPVPEAAGTTSSWGADVEFFWHTDNPNWPFDDQSQDVTASVPNFLAFTAVRNLERASTDIVCVDHIVSQLPAWAIVQLQRPAYTFGAPASNEGFDGQQKVLPILEQGDSGYRLRFDDGIVAALDPDSKEALGLLCQCLRDAQGIAVVLQPGDFFIFKNARVLHRRKAFQPMPNSEARWLRRVYGS
ncbi:TauD/TfdA family dioxygenase [Pseudomonas batumici]|uniref:TauD/TfdA family dioxygenase n=1 Tax=Pseudomonas batumici TaxID=226910 RepID=UPI0030CBB8FE